MTRPVLRPFLPDDAEACDDLRVAAIFELAEDDYSEDQRAAWAAMSDAAALAARLAAGLTLVVASEDEGIVGFGTLKDNSHIEFLFTRPDFARRGVATLVMDALEKLAAARGAKKLTTDASDTGQPFFAARGYVAVRRNTVSVDGEWLANTTMEKTLVGGLAPQGRA
ncbi:MAG TPA: GNAT family N-acetyltransferase [Beijerinckiaceae bacterium]|nr:GNAT family N-acetyltransferase [Beijerinckiaceae bacterium]